MLITVTLDALWLNPATDLTTAMSFPLHSIDYSPVVNVSTRLYAGGNFRAVRQPGKQRVAKVQLVGCTDVQEKQLEDWQGVLLCYRDPRGRKFFGLYTDSDFTPALIDDYWSVSFTVTEVTHSEAV